MKKWEEGLGRKQILPVAYPVAGISSARVLATALCGALPGKPLVAHVQKLWHKERSRPPRCYRAQNA